MHLADHEDIASRMRKRARQRRRDITWNFLTGVVVLATVALVGVILILFSNPYVALNPFPPPTMPALGGHTESANPLAQLPPTQTPAAFKTDTPLIAASESSRTATPPSAPSESAQPTLIIEPDDPNRPYAVEGSLAAMPNTVFHPGDGCDWQGVAGRVVDLQGRPVAGVVIRVSGTYDGRALDVNVPAGGAAAWYGDSGYEYVLGSRPLNSNALLAVQLLDQDLRPLSNRIIFSTFSACDKNLILINFRQVR